MVLHRNNRRRYQVRMPLTSLVDIVFLLLIYFLLTTNFMVDEGIKIKLPQANTSPPQIQREITVSVDQEGRAFLGKQEFTPGDLFERLREMIGEQKDRLIVVRADRDVILNKAVMIMDVVKAAGADRLCLATEKEF